MGPYPYCSHGQLVTERCDACDRLVPPPVYISYLHVGRWGQCAHCGVIYLSLSNDSRDSHGNIVQDWNSHWCNAPWQQKAKDIPFEWTPGQSPLMKKN